MLSPKSKVTAASFTHRRVAVSEFSPAPPQEEKALFDLLGFINSKEHFYSFLVVLATSAKENFGQSGAAWDSIDMLLSALFTVPHLMLAEREILKEIDYDVRNSHFDTRMSLFATLTKSKAMQSARITYRCLLFATVVMVGLIVSLARGYSSADHNFLFAVKAGFSLAYVLFYHFRVLGLEQLRQAYLKERNDFFSTHNTIEAPEKKSHEKLKKMPSALENPQNNQSQGYIINQVTPDGDCGYTAFGITPQDAEQLLLNNIATISAIIGPAVREALVTEMFHQRLSEQNLEYLPSLETLSNNECLIWLFEKNIDVLGAYIQYDVRDKKIEAGYCHPSVLHALAHIRGIELHMWRLGQDNSLVPNSLYGQDYSVYRPTEPSETRIDLLFRNNNHFDLLEIHGYPNGIPDTDISPFLASPASSINEVRPFSVDNSSESSGVTVSQNKSSLFRDKGHGSCSSLNSEPLFS